MKTTGVCSAVIMHTRAAALNLVARSLSLTGQLITGCMSIPGATLNFNNQPTGVYCQANSHAKKKVELCTFLLYKVIDRDDLFDTRISLAAL